MRSRQIVLGRLGMNMLSLLFDMVLAGSNNELQGVDAELHERVGHTPVCLCQLERVQCSMRGEDEAVLGVSSEVDGTKGSATEVGHIATRSQLTRMNRESRRITWKDQTRLSEGTFSASLTGHPVEPVLTFQLV